MIRALVIGAVGAMTLSLGAPAALAQSKQVMRLSSFVQADSSWNKAQDAFKKHVEELSKGRLEVQIYNNNTLGSNREALEMARLGTVDFVMAGVTHSSRFVPQVNAIVFPYLWKDRETLKAALDGPVTEYLDKLYGEKGFKIVGWWDNGFRHVTNSKRPIMTVADFRGLKLRTLPAKIHVEFFRAVGAAPTPMDWSEVLPALRQGTIDGQENPAVLVHAFRVYEVQKYYSLTAHVNEPLILLMSKPVHDRLAPDLRKAVTDAGRMATELQWKLNAEDDASVMAQLRQTSMAVNDVPAATQAELRKLAASIYPKAVDELGPGGKEFIETLVKLNQ
ncbi:MAG: TRAP transporter substrate-binding protein [Alphaproteobacteria bacterium]